MATCQGAVVMNVTYLFASLIGTLVMSSVFYLLLGWLGVDANQVWPFLLGLVFILFLIGYQLPLYLFRHRQR